MNDLLQSVAQHPDAEQLAAFAEHALPLHEHQQTLAHLAACADCRHIVFLAQQAEPDEQPLVEPVGVRKPWFAGWNLVWAATAAFAGIVAFSVLLRHPAKPTPINVTTAKIAEPPPVAAPQATPQRAPVARVSPAPLVKQPKPIPPMAAESNRALSNDSVSDMTVGGRNVIDLRAAQPAAGKPAARPSAPMHGAMGMSAGIAGGVGIGRVLIPPAAAPTVRTAPTAGPGYVVGAAAAPNQDSVALSQQRQRLPPPQAPPPPQQQLGDTNAFASQGLEVSSAQQTLNQQLAAAPLPAPPPPPQFDSKAARINQSTVDTNNNASASATVINSVALANGRGVGLAAPALPSHLRAVSTVASGGKTLALDSNGTLFLSKDAGVTWKAVKAQWTGRAVNVSLGSSPPPAITGLSAPMKIPAPLPASAASAHLTGTVTDPTGAAIPSALVVLRAGTDSYTARTDSAGHYTLAVNAAGSVELSISAPGFKSSQQSLQLQPHAEANVGTTLQIGAATQTVTVSAEQAAPALNARALRKSKSPLKPEPFKLTSDDGATWLSSDGQSWKRQ